MFLNDQVKDATQPGPAHGIPSDGAKGEGAVSAKCPLQPIQYVNEQLSPFRGRDARCCLDTRGHDSLRNRGGEGATALDTIRSDTETGKAMSVTMVQSKNNREDPVAPRRPPARIKRFLSAIAAQLKERDQLLFEQKILSLIISKHGRLGACDADGGDWQTIQNNGVRRLAELEGRKINKAVFAARSAVKRSPKWVQAPARRLFRRLLNPEAAALPPGPPRTPAVAVPFGAHQPQPTLSAPLGVVMHIFYPELATEMRAYLENIPGPVNLYISTDTDAKKAQLTRVFNGWTAGCVEIRLAPNRGRDIAPKLVTFRDIYDHHPIVLHLHSKKSPHDSNLRLWRYFLFENLMGNRDIAASILSAFENDPSLGMVASDHYFAVSDLIRWGENLAPAQALAARMSVRVDPTTAIDFPSGSMFWARSEALKPLLDLGLAAKDFPPETRQVDGTLAHAIERLFFVSCEKAGFRWARVARPEFDIEHGSTRRVTALAEDIASLSPLFDLVAPKSGNPDAVYTRLGSQTSPIPPYSDGSGIERLDLVLESSPVAITFFVPRIGDSGTPSDRDSLFELIAALARNRELVRVVALLESSSAFEIKFRTNLIDRFDCPRDAQQRIQVLDAATRPAPCGQTDLFVGTDLSSARLLTSAIVEHGLATNYFHLVSPDETIPPLWPNALASAYQSACGRLMLDRERLRDLVLRLSEEARVRRAAPLERAFSLQSTWGLGYRAPKPWPDGVRPGRVCLFAHWDSGDQIDPHVVRYLQALKACGRQIVFISSSNLSSETLANVDSLVDATICRENLGLDFSGWAVALEALPALRQAEELIIANDSVYGPIGDLGAIFERMQASPFDIWGCVESCERERHIQSWFVCFGKKAIQSEAFESFWRSVMPLTNKSALINNYELGLLKFFKAAGLNVGSMIDANAFDSVNPTMHPWRELLKEGLPFVKVELFKENPLSASLEGWTDEIAGYGYPPSVIVQHLRRVEGSRAAGLKIR